jgi:hypothetical protein
MCDASPTNHDVVVAQEAHVIGTLHAIDRLEIARGLPKHLKIYAVVEAYLDVFGVPAMR